MLGKESMSVNLCAWCGLSLQEWSTQEDARGEAWKIEKIATLRTRER